jgi:hypothetical protein
MSTTEMQEIYYQWQSYGTNARLTEWGSGGSTVLWHANIKNQQSVISVENDPEWHVAVCKAIEKSPAKQNFTYLLYPTEDDGATFTPEESYYTPYVHAVDEVWDSHVYLVDGRVRIWCAKTIAERARRPNAVVYCHDYAFNECWWNTLLPLYKRHEIINTTGTDNVMLKLWLI